MRTDGSAYASETKEREMYRSVYKNPKAYIRQYMLQLNYRLQESCMVDTRVRRHRFKSIHKMCNYNIFSNEIPWIRAQHEQHTQAHTYQSDTLTSRSRDDGRAKSPVNIAWVHTAKSPPLRRSFFRSRGENPTETN